MLSIAVIEDDEKFSAALQKALLKYAADNGMIFQIAAYGSVEDFLLPRQLQYDLVFFDIELPGMNGMDGAKKFRDTDSDAVIIFITQVANLAIKGYEVDAADYIVKPVSYSKLAFKLQKAIARIDEKKYRSVVIHSRNGVQKFRSSEIFFVEIRGHDLTFHTERGNFDTTGSLASYEQALAGYGFSRCNSCYLVNMHSIIRIDGMTVTLVSGEEILISRRKKKEFLEEFTQFIGKQ